MSFDPKVLTAVSEVLANLRSEPHLPMPASIIQALAPVARLGLNLKIDMNVGESIGAPLVVISERTSNMEFLAPLTPRQKQVADLLICGKSNKLIARELDISVATVKDHVHAILDRLNKPTRRAVMAASHRVHEE
ncbi:MAG: LuxR C-terminal-related transcriptional regulator [Roseibium sp.]